MFGVFFGFPNLCCRCAFLFFKVYFKGSNVDCDGIVLVLSSWTAGLYTLVMEFCPSNLFQQVLEAKHRAMIRGSYVYQPPAQTLDWLGQIFLGLEHMHNRLEILFRDAWLQLAEDTPVQENTPLALLHSTQV